MLIFRCRRAMPRRFAIAAACLLPADAAFADTFSHYRLAGCYDAAAAIDCCPPIVLSPIPYDSQRHTAAIIAVTSYYCCHGCLSCLMLTALPPCYI